LPLDAGSVTAPAVNLPFGAQVGSVEENRDLYRHFCAKRRGCCAPAPAVLR
jgi:hypothetical protein